MAASSMLLNRKLGQRGGEESEVCVCVCARVCVRVRVVGWVGSCVCSVCVFMSAHVCTRARRRSKGVHRAQRSVQGGEASDEASVTAAITQCTLGGPETAHRRTGPWITLLAECGHVFQIAEFKTSAGGIWERNLGPHYGQPSADHFWERNFGAKFWSVKC